MVGVAVHELALLDDRHVFTRRYPRKMYTGVVTRIP